VIRASPEAIERLDERLDAAVRAGLKDAFRGLQTRDFDHLIFAHGEPLIGGGKAALRDFVSY
jgi:hypothetical protein